MWNILQIVLVVIEIILVLLNLKTKFLKTTVIVVFIIQLMLTGYGLKNYYNRNYGKPKWACAEAYGCDCKKGESTCKCYYTDTRHGENRQIEITCPNQNV